MVLQQCIVTKVKVKAGNMTASDSLVRTQAWRDLALDARNATPAVGQISQDTTGDINEAAHVAINNAQEDGPYISASKNNVPSSKFLTTLAAH